MSLRVFTAFVLLLAAGCGGHDAYAPLAGNVPAGAAASRQQTKKNKIQHVIVVIQENRSFDHLFQGFPGANTQNYGLNEMGQQVPLVQVPLNQKFDPAHGHDTFVTEADYDANSGQYRMDGFDQAGMCHGKPSCKTSVYTYVQHSDVANYWRFAQSYALGDMTFQTNMGPSWSSHQYLIAGQSGGYTSSQAALYQDPAGYTTCAQPTHHFPTIDMTQPYPGVAGAKQPSCVTYPTIFDELNTAGIAWKYYARSLTGFWTAPSSVLSLYTNYEQNVSVPSTNVLGDIANHTLPPVAYVTPGDTFSDHPYLGLTNHGQDWIALIANAIGSDPYYWQNTVILVMWDDWGGFYDHVPPPSAPNPAGGNPNPNEYGMRVPFIVIGAYVKPHLVDHTVRAAVATLTFIENVFGLPSLGTLDAQQDDLMTLFNFRQTPNVYKKVTTHGWTGGDARRAALRDRGPIDSDMP